ncbi:MAG: COR domain-containing protein, partial [Chitinophagales bacterium]
ELQHFELEDYHRLESMQSLFLEKNDLQEIPKENWEKGGNCWELVRAYLEAAESGLIINQEAKVVWFGNGRAGKTTLSYQLRERLFKDFEQTHGIEIKDWKIPYERLPQALKDRMTASLAEAKAQHPQTKLELPAHIVLKLWDFGGQEYYHATHRLFLNSNVLYLLVWNQATDFQAEDADPAKCIYPRSYWRHNIQYYAEEGEIILEIQNKAQQEAYTNRAALQYKVAYRNAEQPRSLQRYELDVADLEDAIIAQLSNLTYLGQTFPEVYDHIRQALRDNPKDYLSYADYVAFCEEQDTTRGKGKENLMQQATQIKALTEFLHDTGTLICYRYTPNCPELLKDFVFIRPQWVTDMIYRILDKKLVDQKDNPGEFDKRYVEQVTQESGLSADTWIELMKQFQLIFEVNREGKVYFIAPQYLPMDCTNLIGKKWALKSNPVHQFSLHFPRFLPKSHFLQFVA